MLKLDFGILSIPIFRDGMLGAAVKPKAQDAQGKVMSKPKKQKNKAKRRAKSKSARATKRSDEGKPGGFDYGCLRRVMAIASPEFLEDLNEASINAMVYGEAQSPVLRAVVPSLALGAQNAAPLVRAFEKFHAWSESSDGDAVEVTVLLQEDAGYTLAIGPEFRRLEQRCLGYQISSEAITNGFMWMKRFDTVNPLLLKLREYCEAPISPLLFGGLVYHATNERVQAGGNPDLRVPQGLQPLLKFDVRFEDESDAKPGTFAFAKNHSGKAPEGVHRATLESPEAIAAKRSRTMRAAFPVTLERIHKSSWFAEVATCMSSEGVRPWQVEQAVCNLGLSASLGRGKHYGGAEESEVEELVSEALDSRAERADSKSLQRPEVNDVRVQVLADITAFLRYSGNRAAKDLKSGLKRMGEEHIMRGEESWIPPSFSARR